MLTRFDYTFSENGFHFRALFLGQDFRTIAVCGSRTIASEAARFPIGPERTIPCRNTRPSRSGTLFTPTLVNLATISYSRPTKSSAELTPAAAPNGTTPLQFFGTGAGVEDGFIVSTAYGLTPLGPAPGTGHFTFAENRYAIGDDLLWTHGAHSVRMGFAWRPSAQQQLEPDL